MNTEGTLLFPASTSSCIVRRCPAESPAICALSRVNAASMGPRICEHADGAGVGDTVAYGKEKRSGGRVFRGQQGLCCFGSADSVRNSSTSINVEREIVPA